MCIILNYARYVQRVNRSMSIIIPLHINREGYGSLFVCVCVCVCVCYQILSKLEVLAPKGSTPTF